MSCNTGVKELTALTTGAKKHEKRDIQADRNGDSREKVEKVTKVAVETYKKAMKELEKH